MMQSGSFIDELLRLAHKGGASDLIVRTFDRVRMRIGGYIVTDYASDPSPARCAGCRIRQPSGFSLQPGRHLPFSHACAAQQQQFRHCRPSDSATHPRL